MQQIQFQRTAWRIALLGMIIGLCAGLVWVGESAQAADAKGNTHRGTIQVRPDGTLEGPWTIGDEAFVGTSTTVVDGDEAGLTVDACAEVRYRNRNSEREITRIRALEPDKCSETDDPERDRDRDQTGENEDPERDRDRDQDQDGAGNRRVLYGILDSIDESGDVPIWTIDGQPYRVGPETEREADHGPFEPGACVKVKWVETDAIPVAQEVETERAYKCGNGAGGDDTPGDDSADQFEAELYGVVEEIPAGGFGTWLIAGFEITVDANTEFDPDMAAIQQQATVKVHVVTDIDGNNYAREIELRLAAREREREHEGDDDEHGEHRGWIPGSEGHAYGWVDVFPDHSSIGPLGRWVIGGAEYVITPETRLDDQDGRFGEQVWVKVKYRLNQDGQRVALMIRALNERRFAEDNMVTLFGLVDKVPDLTTDGKQTFIGGWLVGNVPLEGVDSSQFIETFGLLGVGAYVRVDYQVVDGINVIHRMKSYVPPGAGEFTHRGRIEHMGGDDVTAAGLAADTIWVIDGVEYVVSEATDVDESRGALSVNQMVIVNSTADADGAQIATQILAAGDSKIFLPFTVSR